MGTRNLTIVAIAGEYKVAQYGQWDGYPEGQGVTILEFLHSADFNIFAEKVKKCREITEEESEEQLRSVGVLSSAAGWMNMEQADKFNQLYPESSRDTGGKILSLIYNSLDGLALSNQIGFAKEFGCEWAYVVDFDKMTFEVYKGYNQEPLTKEDRFFKMQNIKETIKSYKKSNISGFGPFYPVKMIKSFPLEDLPNTEEFISLLNEADPDIELEEEDIAPEEV